jgi:hypothetical protein
MYCKYCSRKNSPNIFDFQSFDQFKKLIPTANVYDFLITYHNLGFTLLHCLFFRFAIERLKHRNPILSSECKKIIYYLAIHYPSEFKKACEIGTKEDVGNTPLHDYIKNIPFMKKNDYQLIEFLYTLNINFDIKDRFEMNVKDYIKAKTINFNLMKKIKHYQHCMKSIEKEVVEWCLLHFHNIFQYCEKCGNYFNVFIDIKNIEPNIWKNNINSSIYKKIEKIIKLRTLIAKLYKNSFTTKSSEHNHQEIINIWKSKLEQSIIS